MAPKDVNIRLDGEMGALLRQRGVRSVNRWVNDLVAGHLGAGKAEKVSPAVGKNGLPLVASQGTDQAWFVYAQHHFYLARVVQVNSQRIWLDALDVIFADTEETWSWSPVSMDLDLISAFVKVPQNGREAVVVLKDFMREHGGVEDMLGNDLGIKLCREMDMLPSRDGLELLSMEPRWGNNHGQRWLSEEGSNLEGRLIYVDIVVTRKPDYALDVVLEGGVEFRIGGGSSLLPRDTSRSRTKKADSSWKIEAGETHAVFEQGLRLIAYPMLLWPNQAELIVWENRQLHMAVDVTCEIYLQPSRPKTKPSPPFTG